MDRKTDIQEAIEEILVDPDSPDRGATTPPQTIDAEPNTPEPEKK